MNQTQHLLHFKSFLLAAFNVKNQQFGTSLIILQRNVLVFRNLTCEGQSDHLIGQLKCVGPIHRPRPLYPGAAFSDPRHACSGRAGDGRRPEHTPSHTQSHTPM